MKTITRLVAGGAIALSALLPAQAANITGAGATFPAPVYAKWAEAYRAATKNSLNYQAIGSGGGVKQIRAKTVDFGASDDATPGDELERHKLLQFPAVIGGIVPVVNLTGIAPGQMKLDGKVLAAIFRGAIKNWNDPAIAALNGDLKLPSTAITLVYRSDSAGTTAVFTQYLAELDPEFGKAVGAGKTVNWASGVGGKGNAGVAANVMKIGGSIGYVEYAYAKQNKMSHTAMINKAGKVVQPSDVAFAAAADGADWSKAPGFGISLNNQAGDKAWPITSASYILMHKLADKPAQSAEALKFFRWALNNGQKLALELDYVPLPESLVKQIESSWSEIRDASGKPVLGN